MDEGRYWVIQDEEGVNRLHAVSIAAGYTVVGLVDEEAGGIIAYGGFDAINAICAHLNASAGVGS